MTKSIFLDINPRTKNGFYVVKNNGSTIGRFLARKAGNTKTAFSFDLIDIESKFPQYNPVGCIHPDFVSGHERVQTQVPEAFYTDQRPMTPAKAECESRRAESLKASATQVGGDHYVTLGLQPLEATYRLFGYAGLKAAIFTKVMKYMTREKDNEVQQLEKAKHCIELLIEKAKEQ